MTSEFHLGPWLVAPSLNRLRAGDTIVHLEPKVMQVLVRLATRPGQVVSREQLIGDIWADTFVTDDVLKRSISELRNALGDDARAPVYIETIPKGGYRLVAPVSPVSLPDAEPVPRPGQATVGPALVDGNTRSPQFTRGELVSWFRPRLRPILLASLVAAVFAIAWWSTRDRSAATTGVQPAAPAPRSLTRLTFGPGLQTDATWSPDGRFIAYASDRAGNFDIWVQPATGGEPVQVTKSPANDTQPDWSPDGSRIVFRSERDGGGLFVVPALGGIERRLTSFGTHPSWSLDHREILFVDGAAHGEGEWWMKLYAVSPEEGTPREVLAEFLRGGGWYWIEPHPDGRISALGNHEQLGPGFYTVRRDGTEIVRSQVSAAVTLPVTAGGGKDRRRFRWDPSGAALYLQTDLNAVYNLWKVHVDTSTLAWLSAERLTTGPGPDLQPALSRGGTRLAFTSQHETSRLWVFPLDPTAQRLGSGRPLTEDRAVAEWASLSPNGRHVAYNLVRPGIDDRELWLADIIDGTNELVTTSAFVGCWSPDGRAITYADLRLDQEPRVFALLVRHLDGRERYLSRRSTDFFFAPSHWIDGALLGSYQVPAFSGPVALALWPTDNPDADKPERILIATAGANLWQARFSPNRRWLTFVAHRPDRPTGLELFVAPAEGSGPEGWTRIAPDHAWPDKLRWAPDGRTLYFISRGPSSYFNLWGVGVDPDRGTPVGEPFALTAFDSPGMFISPEIITSEIGISSQHAVLTIRNVTGSIWMLDGVDR